MRIFSTNARRLSLLSALPTALLLGGGLLGCGGAATPAEMPGVRTSYNEAIVRSSNEQLLLNLVRLRYLHAPQFMEVTSVASQSSLTQSSSAALTVNLGNHLGLRDSTLAYGAPSIGGAISASQRPTVSYAPLAGEAFTQRMVHPIQPRTIFGLANVGWRIDRLFACCVARVNDLAAPVLASSEPRFGGDRFRRVGEILYALQERGVLSIDELLVGDRRELHLSLGPDEGPTAALAAEARELLGLTPGRESYRILPGHPPDYVGAEGPVDYLVVRGRSLLGALFYLSHGVETPAGDTTARSLGFTDDGGAEVEVPNPMPGALLRVSVGEDEPEGAYVRTLYDGHWYGVDDADLESKQVVLLLQVLFSALSASDEDAATLTIPVGG